MTAIASSPALSCSAPARRRACCSPGGGSPFRPGQRPEGQHYFQEAALLGVPEAAMASTPPVLNTADEAVAIRRLLPACQSWVVLVTSAFHIWCCHRLF